MPLLLGRPWTIEQLQERWARCYRELDAILGPSFTQLPFGDPTYGLASATTFTGRRRQSAGLAPTWTWSEAPSGFDDPLVPTLEKSYQGIIPILDCNGTDEEADTPDAAGWTSTTRVSAGLWVYLRPPTTNAAGTAEDFWGRWDLTTGAEAREFRLFMNSSGQFNGVVYDESNNAQIGRLSDRLLYPGRWYHLAMTYGSGTTSTSVILYINGVRDDTAVSEAGTGFSLIRNTATLTRLGFHIAAGGTSAGYVNGKMAGGPCGPIWEPVEWTPMQVKALYEKQKEWLGL